MAVEEVTYFSEKKQIECPVCGSKFKPEIMREGRGRLSAGELTNELRRTYIPTAKFGKVNPLLYPIYVCPSCLYAAEPADYMRPPDPVIEKLREYRSVRAKYLISLFGRVPDFAEKRDLISGVSSYLMAISSYSFFEPKKFSSSIKMGIASLRAAWLMNDLFEETAEPLYTELANGLYQKASVFYDRALAGQTNGKEPLDFEPWLGPDTDNNFGYDGFLYVTSILRYKTALYIEDPMEKVEAYEQIKRVLSKVFGMGRKARDKPQDLLNLARDAYDAIGEEQKQIQAMLDGEEIPEDENSEAAEGTEAGGSAEDIEIPEP